MVAGAILYKHGRIQHFIPYTHPQGAGSPPTHARAFPSPRPPARSCSAPRSQWSPSPRRVSSSPSEPSPSTSSLKPPASSSHHLSSKQFRKHPGPRTRTRAPRMPPHSGCHGPRCICRVYFGSAIKHTGRLLSKYTDVISVYAIY